MKWLAIETLVFNLLRWLSIGIILLSLMANMDIATSQNSLSTQDIRAIVERAKDAWVARDAEALAQLFTADGELLVPGQRWQGQAKIREEIAKFARQYIDVKITIHRIVIDGDSRPVGVREASACAQRLCQQAAVEWHYEDTEQSTGKRNRSDDAIVIEVQNGLISYWREYFDTGGK
jgi:uncharacterized protein (TIGR02246 family)